MKVKVKSLSCIRLFATPWTIVHQAPPSTGFSRQEYWSGVPLPSPRNGTYISWITGGFFTTELPGKPLRVWPQTNRISHSSGICEWGTFSGPNPDTLNQKLWEWGPASCVLTIPPGDSDARQSLRTTDLLISRICHVSVPKQLSFIMIKGSDSVDLGRGSHVLALVS